MCSEINYRKIDDLPKLAWVASLGLEDGDLIVFHGSAVECRDQWMAEGVRDADFTQGNFHVSENFFGSGIKIDGNSIYFAAFTSLDDRFLNCFHQDALLVSNSLLVLLGFSKAILDFDHIYRECYSINNGIKRYKKGFPVIHGEIKSFYQVYTSIQRI